MKSKINYHWVENEIIALSPSKRATQELKIPDHWYIQKNRFTAVRDGHGKSNVSAPILHLLAKIKTEQQTQYIEELVEVLKTFDEKNQVNWRDTDFLVERQRMYCIFKQTDIAKTIKQKYYGQSNSSTRMITANNKMKVGGEFNDAFDEWLEKK